MLFTYYVLAIVAISSLSSTDAYRILVLFPIPARSHSFLGHGVVRHLLEAGHEVVHVTTYAGNEPKERLKEIELSELQARVTKLLDEMDALKIKNLVGKEPSSSPLMAILFSQKIYEMFFESENFLNLLRDPTEKFDAVITEWFFFNGVAGIASVLECPLIWLATTEAHWNILKLVDEATNPAYTTDLLSMNETPLTFWQRASEFFNIIWQTLATSVVVPLMEKPLLNKILSDIAQHRGATVPSYEETIYNGSFLLLNSHPSYGTPFKLPQNAKYIGGYHIEDTVKPLPKDLQKIMDEAKHGVIYFSMGSNFKSSDMSAEMQQSLINMFGNLKETVIWKFETDINNVPSNIHLVKWAPQQSILAHPNLKTFITHGGQLSTTEAIHHGVPVIGIPLAADQHVNMNSVVKSGFGMKVRLTENMDRELRDAVNNIINDSLYTDTAKTLSAIYHDRYMPPGKELVHWVEHVIRTRGAPHLRSPAFMVPWHQKLYLDLIALISVILVIIYFLVRITKNIFSNRPVKKDKNL